MALLTFALDESQTLVHVDDVPKGLKCGCFCPHCGAKLYAKNGGTIREHHFAHEHGAECEGAYESSMHRLAKEILQESQCIMLPESYDNSKPSGLVKIRNIEIEKWDEQYSIRPDAEGILENGQRLLIEFFFSHKVDGKKRSIIVDNNLLCVEIDINYQELDRNELKRFLTESDEDREWVKPKAPASNSGEYGGYGRNPLYDKTRDRLKEIFEEGSFFIGGCAELGFKTYDIKKYGYDTCEVNTKFRGFRSDLLLYRSQREEKEYIAVCVRGRRRFEPFKKPKSLRIIDIVLSGTCSESQVESFVSKGESHGYSTGMICWNFKHSGQTV